MKTKITVITIAYNEEKNIEKTLQSVTSQTYPHVEYLVLDGKSTDNTISIIKKHEREITRWTSEPDLGIYDAMNKGVEMATGEYVNFMNAGDVFCDETVVERVMEKADVNADMIYGDHQMIYPTFVKRKKPLALENMYQGMPFSHQALFAKTKVLRESPFQWDRYPISADYHFIYKQYHEHKSFCYVPIDVALFASGGISETRVLESYREVQRTVAEFGGTEEMINYQEKFIAYQHKLARLKKILPASVFEFLMKVKNMLARK